MGVNAYGASLDVGQPATLEGFVKNSAAALGGLDILVCNASAFADGPGEDAFRAAFEIDLLHTRNACEAALPWLEASAAGSIIAISSISGVEDYGYDSVSYGTMKAALFFYLKSLARHVAARGIRANVVSPGTTLFDGGFWDRVRKNDPKSFAANVAANPMGRMGRPEEIADAVVFLASPRASFISGTNLVVDGTLTMRVQV
jgi:NAD(P)-dependent dehydrogenase (short-subunit alcohol dehydrogenase family)